MKNIKNYIQLSTSLATSGQPLESQFQKISQAGYTAIINLAMPNHHDAVQNEDLLATSLGMSYFHIPVPFDSPTSEHVRLFCNVMKSLQGQRVWVHCMMNYRASVFVFHYLNKVEMLPPEESMSPIFKSWTPNKTWQCILSLSSKDIGL